MTELLLANTHFDHMDEQLVIYYKIKARPMDDIQPNLFAQLDYILCDAELFANMKDIFSMRKVALASHHFLLICQM